MGNDLQAKVGVESGKVLLVESATTPGTPEPLQHQTVGSTNTPLAIGSVHSLRRSV
jgi:hypothetical protein